MTSNGANWSEDIQSRYPNISEKSKNNIKAIGIDMNRFLKINSPHDLSLNDLRKTITIRKNWMYPMYILDLSM